MWIPYVDLWMILRLRAKLLCRRYFHILALLEFQEMWYSEICLALRHAMIEERLAAIDNLLGRLFWRARRRLLHQCLSEYQQGHLL